MVGASSPVHHHQCITPNTRSKSPNQITQAQAQLVHRPVRPAATTFREVLPALVSGASPPSNKEPRVSRSTGQSVPALQQDCDKVASRSCTTTTRSTVHQSVHVAQLKCSPDQGYNLASSTMPAFHVVHHQHHHPHCHNHHHHPITSRLIWSHTSAEPHQSKRRLPAQLPASPTGAQGVAIHHPVRLPSNLIRQYS